MITTIFLASSMSFYRKLFEIEEKLAARGFEVKIPISAQWMKETGDFSKNSFKSGHTDKDRARFIKQNFDGISLSDALLVINEYKHGIRGYIGTNVLMEIAVAFHSGSKIYILNPIQIDAAYKEELDAFDVEYLNQNLDKIPQK